MGEESNPGDVSLLLIILPEMKKVAKPSKSGQTVKMSNGLSTMQGCNFPKCDKGTHHSGTRPG